MKKIYKKISILFVLILGIVALLSFAGCKQNDGGDETNGKTPTLTFNQAVITIKPYETFNIIATWTGEGEVTWSTADATIATVNNGLVTGINPGQTTITATAGEVSKNCYITVLLGDEVPTINVNNADNGVVQLNVNDEYNLAVAVSFSSEKVNASIKFSSSNEQVITVDKNGKITAQGVGEAYVYVSGTWREFNESVINTIIKVIVNSKVDFYLIAEQSSIYALASLDSESFTCQTKITPVLNIDGVNCEEGFVFESSDTSILTVDGNGVVSGKKVGEAVVSCYYQHGETQLYTKANIEVLPIVREKELSSPLTIELSTVPTADLLNSIFLDERETVKIVDVTEKEKTISINANDNTIVDDENLITGDRVWEVHNDAYAYRVEVLVVDYVINTAQRFKEVLPGIKKDAYIILGDNITNVGNFSGWNSFSGTFDGKGYVISDINIKDRGFFGILEGNATIKNMAVSNVTLSGTSGVFCVQANSAVIDNVSVCIAGVSTTETTPCGGLAFQVGGRLNVKNTLVYAPNVKDANFGAVVGAWWGGECNISNSYFITDGTPCGKVYKAGSADNYNSKGVAENEKGAWSYVYSSIDAFAEELAKTDSKVNIVGFDKEYWDTSSKIPTFINDISFKTVLSKEVEGAKNGGELFYFSKNLTVPTGYVENNVKNGYYNVVLPQAIQGNVSEVYLGSIKVGGFNFVNAERKLQIPVTMLDGMICGQNNMLIVTEQDLYHCAITIADYVIETCDDFMSVLPVITSSEYVVLGANIEWDGTKTFTRNVNQNFNGTFDGKGYVVKNFKQEKSLFQTLQPGAIIRNVGLLGITHTGWNRGIFAGDISRDILLENVVVTLTTSGGSFGLFGALAVKGAPVTLRNTIISVSSESAQNAVIARSYIKDAELVMANSYIISSKLPFSSDLGEDDTYDVYGTALSAVCTDLAELKTKSDNLSAFDSNYWTIDQQGNVLFSGVVVFNA